MKIFRRAKIDKIQKKGRLGLSKRKKRSANADKLNRKRNGERRGG